MANKANAILKSHAEAIAKKLEAEIEPGGEHEIAHISHKGKYLGHFGIRRSRSAPHAFIPKQIFLSATQTLSMASCNISRDEWVELIRAKGKL